VNRRGTRVSTLDVTGKGAFSLVTGLSGQAWIAAAKELSFPFLQTVVIGELDAQDLYLEWQRIREIEEAGALLVRPDGYIAWRETLAVHDPIVAREKLSAAITAVLSRPLPADAARGARLVPSEN
jgi:2,4-dichlorophenol 6-monooxygenase